MIKLIKDPKEDGCMNCIVNKKFNNIPSKSDCEAFILSNNLEDCCSDSKGLEMIFIEDATVD